jgi:hypothetical protein
MNEWLCAAQHHILKNTRWVADLEANTNESVSKSSQTASVTKYTLFFDSGRCCLLQSSVLLSSRNVSANTRNSAETDFWKLRVVTGPEVQEIRGNGALVAQISFSETRRKHMTPHNPSKEGVETQPWFGNQRLMHPPSSVSRSIFKVHQTVLIPP